MAAPVLAAAALTRDEKNKDCIKRINKLTAIDGSTLLLLKSLGLLRAREYTVTGRAVNAGRLRKRRSRRVRKQKRGNRGGTRAKLKANPYRAPLPSILLANVRSLENKLDYLRLELTTRKEIGDCCVLIFTETWLNADVPDSAIDMEGLTTFRADRSSALSDTKEALNTLYNSISELNSIHPDGVIIVAGDFNQANMRKVLPHYHQHVDFATRGTNTLDHAYTNIKGAFKALPRPHLGSSDHSSVLLIPTYKPVLTRSKPVVRQVKAWPAGGTDALQDCFESTDWSVFKEASTGPLGVNIEEYAEAVSGYIQKCTEDLCVTKHITVRANQKPWLTNEVRAKLRARNAAFKSGDETALRSARANLNRAIRDAKRAHRKKIEGHFQDCKDARRLWQGIKAITDYKPAPLQCDDNTDFLNELNSYFGRFDERNNTPATKAPHHQDDQSQWQRHFVPLCNYKLVVNEGISSQKAVGDIISKLKTCAIHFNHSVLAKQWDIISNLSETLGPIE
ncbi:hypothetical protein N1851_006689 [Merluccius polli]|uniref:Endonuclease/exonuclease/phosphatase domain-containing protein n=1 Tax=Merluccius polli TaxID=89951 RepID=A0AA47N484_MERPO|nr:hypothetical protein N1851_006689 [Merluccius polli]